ncbi:DUF1056 family protein [Secundilactobacillus kimchicus]|nr:DUF1056 family protein [Secundilactobacillus kimchicus]
MIKFIWAYIDLICFLAAMILVCAATYLLAGLAITLLVAAVFLVVIGVVIDYAYSERG